MIACYLSFKELFSEILKSRDSARELFEESIREPTCEGFIELSKSFLSIFDRLIIGCFYCCPKLKLFSEILKSRDSINELFNSPLELLLLQVFDDITNSFR